jgi:hypothetical protein
MVGAGDWQSLENRLVMANRYLIITTPSDGIEFGLTHSLEAWKGLQRQIYLLVLYLC